MNPTNAIDQILRQMWPGRPVSVRVTDDFAMSALVITLTDYGAIPPTACEMRLSRYEIESFQSEVEALDRIVAVLAEAGWKLGLGAPGPFVAFPIDPPVMPEVRVEPVRVTRTRLIELD